MARSKSATETSLLSGTRRDAKGAHSALRSGSFWMSAAEIINQIKALDSQEGAKILALLLEIEAAEKAGCMNDERFDDVADRVLSRHAGLLQKLAQ